MLPKCSLIKYICINAFEYNAIIVYFTVLKPGTLYLAWYSPSYSPSTSGVNCDSVIIASFVKPTAPPPRTQLEK